MSWLPRRPSHTDRRCSSSAASSSGSRAWARGAALTAPALTPALTPNQRPARAEPHRPQMLELGGELVGIAGLGEGRGVDGAGADSGDDVEPESALDDKMVAGPDLPAPLRAAPRKHQCSAHRPTPSSAMPR